ncbi:unnamed protein product, partial [Gongylonema pulchrum]|uniref:Conserved domain protein n=1 Tax=Gongylonema pulchrum TaxID=637853 RepID=A0A183DWH0_9BILA
MLKFYVADKDDALSYLDPICNKKWILLAAVLLLAVLAAIAVP